MDPQVKRHTMHDISSASPTHPHFSRLYSIIRAPIRTAGIRYILNPYDELHVMLRFGIEEFPLDLLVTMEKDDKMTSENPGEIEGRLSISLADREKPLVSLLDVEFGIEGRHTLLEVLDVIHGRSPILPNRSRSNLSRFAFCRNPNTLKIAGLYDWIAQAFIRLSEIGWVPWVVKHASPDRISRDPYTTTGPDCIVIDQLRFDEIIRLRFRHDSGCIVGRWLDIECGRFRDAQRTGIIMSRYRLSPQGSGVPAAPAQTAARETATPAARATATLAAPPPRAVQARGAASQNKLSIAGATSQVPGQNAAPLPRKAASHTKPRLTAAATSEAEHPRVSIRNGPVKDRMDIDFPPLTAKTASQQTPRRAMQTTPRLTVGEASQTAAPRPAQTAPGQPITLLQLEGDKAEKFIKGNLVKDSSKLDWTKW